MTNLEALQSLLEYTNNNLFEKVMSDRDITGSDIYTSEESIDLCCADICLYLLSHPEFKEGLQTTKYSQSSLLTLRRKLLKKHGLSEPGFMEAVW